MQGKGVMCQKIHHWLDSIYLNGKLTLVSYVYLWLIFLSLVTPIQFKLVN